VLNFSPEKILLLLVIALVVMGPQHLPHAAKSLGKMIGQLRQMTGSLQNEVTSALAEPKEALMGSVGDLGLNDLRQSVRSLNPLSPLPPGSSSPSPAPDGPAPASSSTPAGGALGAPVGRGDLPPAPDDPSLN
jgi:sec-independent protein translocase protein TatB